MVRALVIRQVFVLLDLALALGVMAMGGMVAYRVLVPAPDLSSDLSKLAAVSEDGARTLATLAERPAYQDLISKKLFGPAGDFETPKPGDAPPTPPAGEITETELNLRLLGTVALRPDDPFASAIIEDQDQRITKGYTVGQDVTDKVKLVKVFPREVLILNARKNPAKEERLSMDEKEEGEAAPSPAGPAMPVRAEPTEKVNLSREEFVNDLYTNYSDLVTKVKPEMYRDPSGKIAGVTAANISQVPLAGKLGLQDGDVLQTVNNEQIDSEQKIMEMVQKYRNANSFRIGILRGGQTKVITYSLQ